MTESTKNADFRRKPQIFADSPLLLEIPAFGGRRFSQKTADFRRKPQIFAENRRKPQIGHRHLRCVTFSSALNPVQGSKPPKPGKRVSESKKPPFPTTQEKGSLSQKIPISSLQGTTEKMGIFRLKTPFSGVVVNGGFSTAKPSFPDFGWGF